MFGFRREHVDKQHAQPKRPMEAVVAAIESGARSRAEIRRTTGLTESTVDAVIGHLERTGRLTLEELGSSCAGGNCNSCIAAAANGMTCADKPKQSGPVALVLTKRPGVS
ncbi:hypothetical protein [Corynebacterium sp. Marseille-P4321]|uniref:hypothetical protein n=1 Tax=Corynebacterium sp. Marseille-P4321 TaxID=2736603 RepID=UPI00158B5075|nr:hypothetical protein [Corynebacterium sp. Marseille-P4321]